MFERNHKSLIVVASLINVVDFYNTHRDNQLNYANYDVDLAIVRNDQVVFYALINTVWNVADSYHVVNASYGSEIRDFFTNAVRTFAAYILDISGDNDCDGYHSLYQVLVNWSTVYDRVVMFADHNEYVCYNWRINCAHKDEPFKIA